MKTKVSIIKCITYESALVFEAVKRSVDELGGISKFVKPGEKILIKPNLLSAREPEKAVTTHPEVLKAIIKLVKSAGGKPLVGDSPGGAIKGVERVWEKTGTKQAVIDEPAELINFETRGSFEQPVNHHAVKALNLVKLINEVDGIINLPKLKTHGLAVFTGAIKNLYGLIPGLRKAEYHKLSPHPDEFSQLLGELYLAVKHKIRLNVVDGIVGMEGNGPSSGELRKTEVIAASADGLALDCALTSLLGFKPDNLETVKYLKNKNAGESNLSNIEITGDDPSLFNFTKFKFPSTWYMKFVPHFAINLIGKYIWLKPVIVPEICVNCLLCVNSCPVKTIETRKNLKPYIHHSGCISCLCCHELCSYKAIELKSSKLAKFFFKQ